MMMTIGEERMSKDDQVDRVECGVLGCCVELISWRPLLSYWAGSQPSPRLSFLLQLDTLLVLTSWCCTTFCAALFHSEHNLSCCPLDDTSVLCTSILQISAAVVSSFQRLVPTCSLPPPPPPPHSHPVPRSLPPPHDCNRSRRRDGGGQRIRSWR